MKIGYRLVLGSSLVSSDWTRAASVSLAAAGRHPGERLSRLFFLAALLLLSVVRSGVCQEAPAVVSLPGSVTPEILETKIQEVNDTTGR